MFCYTALSCPVAGYPVLLIIVANDNDCILKRSIIIIIIIIIVIVIDFFTLYYWLEKKQVQNNHRFMFSCRPKSDVSSQWLCVVYVLLISPALFLAAGLPLPVVPSHVGAL